MMLAFELQERGFTLTSDDETLIVTPYQKLTPQDCRSIKRWKRHLLALLDYRAPEIG
jgi:hypothetical protein